MSDATEFLDVFPDENDADYNTFLCESKYDFYTFLGELSAGTLAPRGVCPRSAPRHASPIGSIVCGDLRVGQEVSGPMTDARACGRGRGPRRGRRGGGAVREARKGRDGEGRESLASKLTAPPRRRSDRGLAIWVFGLRRTFQYPRSEWETTRGPLLRQPPKSHPGFIPYRNGAHREAHPRG